MSRDLTLEEANEIIERHVPEEDVFMNYRNIRKHTLMDNSFRFTVDIISLDFLISLMEDEEVINVYFNPSAPPPGTGIDGISLRYKVYVQFEQK